MRIQNMGKYLSTTHVSKTNIQYLIMAMCPAAEIPSEAILFQTNFVSRQYVCGHCRLVLDPPIIQEYALIPKGGNLSRSRSRPATIKQELMATSFVRLIISCNLPAVLAWHEVALTICSIEEHQNSVSIGSKTHVELTAEPLKQRMSRTIISIDLAEGGCQ